MSEINSLNNEWLRPTGLIFNNTNNFGNPVGILDDAIYPTNTGALNGSNYTLLTGDDDKYVIYSVQKPTSNPQNFSIYALMRPYISAFPGVPTGLYLWANYTLDGSTWHDFKYNTIPYYYDSTIFVGQPTGYLWLNWSWNDSSPASSYTNPQIMFSGGHIPNVDNPMTSMEAAFVQIDGQTFPLYVNGTTPIENLGGQNNFNAVIMRPTGTYIYHPTWNTTQLNKDLTGYLDEAVFYPDTTGNINELNTKFYGYEFNAINVHTYFLRNTSLSLPITNANLYVVLEQIGVNSSYSGTIFGLTSTFIPQGYNTTYTDYYFYSNEEQFEYSLNPSPMFFKTKLVNPIGNDYPIPTGEFLGPWCNLTITSTTSFPASTSLFNVKALYVELETETHFPLYILGDPTGYVNNNIPMYVPNITSLTSGINLFTQGAYLGVSGVPFYTYGVAGGTTGNIPLYMTAIGASNQGKTLFLQNIVPSSTTNMPLYITTSETGSGSVFGINDGINLFVNQSGYSTQQNIANLFLQGATMASSTEGITLYLSNNNTQTAGLGLTLWNNWSGVYNNVGLYVQQIRDDGPSVFDPYYFELEDGGIPIREGRPLFINAGFGGGVPFYLAVHSESSGGVPFFVQGANIQNSGITLVMPNVNGALTKGLPLFGHGN